MAALVLDASVALAAIVPGEPAAAIADMIVSRVSAECDDRFPPSWSAQADHPRLARVPKSWMLACASMTGGERSRHEVVGITLYDAAYLELALRLKLPLASLDRALRRAAEAERVVLANPPA